jgi:hypothetical protein
LSESLQLHFFFFVPRHLIDLSRFCFSKAIFAVRFRCTDSCAVKVRFSRVYASMLHSPSLLASRSRTKFTPSEDAMLLRLVNRAESVNWQKIARQMSHRTARQCRDRYKNYLASTALSCPWTPAEDSLIAQGFRRLGPRWVEIAKGVPGRTGVQVKNRWHCHVCRAEAKEAARADPPHEAGGLDWARILPPESPKRLRGATLLCDWYY